MLMRESSLIRNYFITTPSETGFFSLEYIDKRIKSMLINDESAGTLCKKRFRLVIIEQGGDKMAIKVIITRKVAGGREEDLLPLLWELRSKAMEQKGYISGETLKGISDPDEFMVISTWRSLEDWNVWNSNPARREIQDKIDALLEQKTVAKAYYYG